jgi:hypothetical protein
MCAAFECREQTHLLDLGFGKRFFDLGVEASQVVLAVVEHQKHTVSLTYREAK